MLLRCARSIVLAVKGCLDVFFMVFKVALNSVVLLKASVFRLILRLHICDSVWYRLATVNSLRSIHCGWRVC